MSIKYHPKHETLLNFAAGNLSPAYISAIDVHTKFCSGCASLASQFEQLGGVSIENQNNQSVDTSFNQLMEKILASKPVTQEQASSVAQIDHIMRYATLHSRHSKLKNDKWIKVARGISDQKIYCNDRKYRTRLIRINAGTKIPTHTHQGQEITVVIKGSFSDTYGSYKAGDYLVRDGSYQHAPYADSDCICYAITDAPLHYTGFFGPVINWYNNRFERKYYGSVA